MIAGNSTPLQRMQQSIAAAAEISGVGLFTGADATIRLLPAPAGHGIAFRRTDCPGSQPIPALIDCAVHRRRRTAIEHQGVAVEMTEHVMAALAGLQIDNCLVELNAPEPPVCDGSSLAFAEALLGVGIVVQDEPREIHSIASPICVDEGADRAEITARPLSRGSLAITYHLDYGTRSPIAPQTLTVEITPENFLNELAFARTFALESEVAALRAQGYGKRVSASDVLVFGADGVIDNQLRADDECVRHKILDCLGDFALLGCDINGHINAYRSGHQLNRELTQRLQLARRRPSPVLLKHAA